VLKGRTALRVSITNFRTTESDLIALLDEVERLGRELDAGSGDGRRAATY
jgi:hypothetical protein